MKRFVLLFTVLALSVPAQAHTIHDPVVPAGPCAAAHSEAVGHPAAPHLLATGKITDFPVSANTPGRSTGSEASANAQGDERCANAQP
jgi:hypothetical protein